MLHSHDKMKIFYDREGDVLYITHGEPEFADYIEHSEDIILRLDPDTKRLVGVTIIDFSRHFEKTDLSSVIRNLFIRRST